MERLLRSVRFIAFFLILSTYPGAMAGGLERHYLPIISLECLIYAGLAVSAVGLFFRQEWGRVSAIVFLAINFFYILYVVVFLIGSAFSGIVAHYEETLSFPRDIIRNGLVAVIVADILWPVVFIYFLTHPRVKFLFSPQFLLRDALDENFS